MPSSPSPSPTATDPLLPRSTAPNSDPHTTPTFSPSNTTNMDSPSPSTTRPRNIYWSLACIYGASAVMLGAFGAHGLKKRIADPQRIANFGTAAQYQVRFQPPHTLSFACEPLI